MQSITVYTKPACMQCNMVKKWLDDRGVEYTVESILDDQTLEAVRSLGLASAPVTVISQGEPKDDVVVPGFQPQRFQELVKLNKE